jgi:hypothetical protein
MDIQHMNIYHDDHTKKQLENVNIFSDEINRNEKDHEDHSKHTHVVGTFFKNSMFEIHLYSNYYDPK